MSVIENVMSLSAVVWTAVVADVVHNHMGCPRLGERSVARIGHVHTFGRGHGVETYVFDVLVTNECECCAVLWPPPFGVIGSGGRNQIVMSPSVRGVLTRSVCYMNQMIRIRNLEFVT